MDCPEVCLLEASQQEFSRSQHNFFIVIIIIAIVIMNRKMITTDINVYFMITGNMLVVVHCLSVTLRTLNGPLPIYAALFFRWNKKAEKIK